MSQELLKYNDTEYYKLLTYTEVRWLRKGKVLQNFFFNLKEVFNILEDPSRICDSSFFADICQKSNQLNLELEGESKNLSEMCY